MTSSAAGGTRLQRIGQIVVTSVGIGVLAVLTLSPNGATRMLAWPWWGLWRILLLVPAAWLLMESWSPSARTRGMDPLVGSLLVAIGTVQLLAAAFSLHPQASLSAALPTIATLMLIGAVSRWLANRPERGSTLAMALATAGAAFALVSLGAWLATQLIPYSLRLAELNDLVGGKRFDFNFDAVRNDRPLGHSSYTAGVAVLALPWVGMQAWRSAGRWRAVWLAATALVIATLITSQTRSAFIGLAAGGGFTVLLVARSARWTWSRTVTVYFVGALALGLAAFAIPRVRAMTAELLSTGELNIGDRQRFSMLQVGTSMGADRWWIGQGPGLTPRLYPTYRHTVDGGVDTALQLHSTPLQIWADTGAPGLVLSGLLLGFALLTVLRRPAHASDDIISRAAAVSLATYAGFSLTDFQLDVPVLAVWTAANIAVLGYRRGHVLILDNTEGRSAQAATSDRIVKNQYMTPIARWPGAAIGVTFLILWCVITPAEWRARSLLDRAVDDVESTGDLAVFKNRIHTASRLLPDDPNLPIAAAVVHMRMLFASPNPEAAAVHRAAAIGFLEQAVVVEPHHEFAHSSLGWLLLGTSPKDAARHSSVALRLAPDRLGAFLALALAHLEAGDPARACEALALELINNPVFATSPSWDTPYLAPHLEGAIARAEAIAREFASHSAATHPDGVMSIARFFEWWQKPDAPFPVEFPAPTPVPPLELHTSGIDLLQAAIESQETRRSLLAAYLLLHQRKPAEPGTLDLLESLIVRHGTDWRAWLQAPEGREAPFVRTYRIERPAFAMLARNMDLPVPIDAGVMQENQLVRLFFSSIIPPRGLPFDPLLVEYVERLEP